MVCVWVGDTALYRRGTCSAIWLFSLLMMITYSWSFPYTKIVLLECSKF